MGNDAAHKLRTQSCDLACNDWQRATEIAAQIDEPWYAAQAYAWCGRYAPERQWIALIDKSFATARSGRDAYQRLGATAWPLRALIERGQPDQAAAIFDTLIGAAQAIEYPGSRAEACFLVFQAVAIGPAPLADRSFRWLLNQLQPATHWRQQRALRDTAIIAMTLGLAQMTDLPMLIADERISNRATTQFIAGVRQEPRRFFWIRESVPTT